jgi:glycosyltransferase involved in cell wall biosynthesis
MKHKPTVSVIIPSYNCARFVTAAVDSVLAQTSPPEEVIVIDDGSTDDTRQLLAPYQDRIRYIHQTNAGISCARNRGIRESSGTLIAFIDADDRWLPQKLALQLECMEANPAVDLVHTEILYWDDRTGELALVPQERERFTGQCYREFFWHCRVLTSSVLLTRRCLDDVGTFDKSIPGGYAEDLDLFLRISRKYSLAFVAEPLVHYRRHGTNATLNSPRMAESAFYVFERVLRQDPQLLERLGSKAALDYLKNLAFQAGYWYVEIGNLPRARGYFRAALKLAPGSAYTWALWVSTFLPLRLRRLLRSAKQRMGQGQRATSLGGA